jgi:hypothetical protein
LEDTVRGLCGEWGIGPRVSMRSCLIPPKELAALVDDVAEGVDRDDEEALSRAVLEMLGLQRLTDNVKKRLATVQFLRS